MNSEAVSNGNILFGSSLRGNLGNMKNLTETSVFANHLEKQERDGHEIPVQRQA